MAEINTMPRMLFCKNCCLNGSDPDLILDEKGICNHCHSAQKSLKECKEEQKNLLWIIEKIKKDGKNKDYDCLIGASGGVDSSMVIHEAVKLKLRPLIFTMDNDFNDMRADDNLLQIVEKLKAPLYRYVLDLEKYRSLQAAYLRAGVINVEAIYDHLLMGASYEMAEKYGIKWIISGGNVATESIMPKSWSFDSRDLVNIKDIYKKTTGREIKGEKGSFPLVSLWKWNWYKWIKGIKIMYLLDFLEYNRSKSIELLKKEYDYNEYGEKHCENTFTWWYQNFYLFNKFGIDKRLAHYSSLINSGQMTRTEAYEKLKESPIYPTLGLEAKVMSYPKRRHEDFKTDQKIFNRIGKIIKFLRRYGIIRRISNNIV